MQDATIVEATYSELEAGLWGFVDAVSDLLDSERMATDCAPNTLDGLESLARSKWSRLWALEGEALRVWISTQVERAHSNILAACERLGCVRPEDRPEPVRQAIALAGRVADGLLAVESRADLQRATPALLDALDELFDALVPPEGVPSPLHSWSKSELIAATAERGVPPISDNTLLRVMRRAGLSGVRGRKGRRLGPSEVRLLIRAAPAAIPNEADRCIRAWNALLNRTG